MSLHRSLLSAVLAWGLVACTPASIKESSGVASARSASFVRDDSADWNGTYRIGTVQLSPAFLVQRFGAPAQADGERVSGTYTFRSPQGAIFTVYDYKATTLWATDESLPSPEQFWSDKSPRQFSIGGRGEPSKEFESWLLAAYRDWTSGRRRQ